MKENYEHGAGGSRSHNELDLRRGNDGGKGYEVLKDNGALLAHRKPLKPWFIRGRRPKTQCNSS
jgi:hypothetical protein